MKALLVSEGRHELSTSDAETSALQELMRRLAPRIESYDRRKVSDRRVRIHTTKGKFPNYGRRLEAWLRYAQLQGYDALIVVVDRDGDADRSAGVAYAQESTSFTIHRAIGLAVESFDAWMLADEQAISRVFATTVQRQPDPESITAPKGHFNYLMRSHNWESGQSEPTFRFAET